MLDLDAIVDAATTAPEAQPQADVREVIEEPKQEGDNPEPAEEPWPKKAENALAKEKGKSAKYKFQAQQATQQLQNLEAELNKYRGQTAQPNQGELSVAKTGIPTKLDPGKFTNWADYSEARSEEIADYKIEQKLAERDGKQKETQRTQQEQAWVSEREKAIEIQAADFIKENPEALAVVQEHADVIDEFSPELRKLFLEADNAPLAFFNLAKEGKLEALATMSLARAAMEIGKAQSAAPEKPKTKAPTPLPASRGSVAGGKRLEDLGGDEIRDWLRS